MRLFQSSGLYSSYKTYLERLSIGATSFEERLNIFLDDRFGSLHFLKPVLDGIPSAFFTNADDLLLQKLWAKENSIPSSATLEQILLTQIEEHRTEVFYNLDPMRFGGTFVNKLPGCVKYKVCWRAAPSHGADFTGYDLVVCNFPTIIQDWRQQGYRSEYFSPAYDSVMDAYACNENRPIDVLFVGGYTRHHMARAQLLESVAGLSNRFRVEYRLDASRMTLLAESPLGIIPPLRKHRRPDSIRCISSPPVFGREMLSMISRSKIVLNGAIDMAGEDRGNMRCYEAMGCGALLVSDQGRYPKGMINNDTMLTYDTPSSAVGVIGHALDNWTQHSQIARGGHIMLKNDYGKDRQWSDFLRLISIL